MGLRILPLQFSPCTEEEAFHCTLVTVAVQGHPAPPKSDISLPLPSPLEKKEERGTASEDWVLPVHDLL